MFREGCWRIIFSLAVGLLVSRGELAAADADSDTYGRPVTNPYSNPHR